MDVQYLMVLIFLFQAQPLCDWRGTCENLYRVFEKGVDGLHQALTEVKAPDQPPSCL
jgi:hypothetical protein